MITAMTMLASKPTATAANAVNALGINLLRRFDHVTGNVLLSPYSIQSALAMAYAGADGDTRAEMAKVLHYPDDEAELHGSFGALRQALDDVVQASAMRCADAKKWGETTDPVTLTVANRLFGQTGYDFRKPFLTLIEERYNAPFEALDFVRHSAGATRHINLWVEEQTRDRIRNLIPDGTLDALTRLVLVNAICLKAPWVDEFHRSATKPRPFHIAAGNPVDVATMADTRRTGYAKRDGFGMLGIPYGSGEIQFLVLLPDEVDGLAQLENQLTPALLNECASLDAQHMVLYLPKFRIEPPVTSLGHELQALGMRSAFDQPPGTANFDRIAPRRMEDYLYISQVFHKTFLDLDENGTEAAAATALAMRGGAMPRPSQPIEVRVDHPFLFAIQHRESGTCLFLGRLTDPR